LLTDGTVVSNATVVIAIRFILAEEFISFGYAKMTDDLRNNHFVINEKKTYRLMKQNHLLCGTVIKNKAEKRKFVQWRVQQADKPMEQLCMDIKYVHIHGQKRNALLLTVLDVYSRSIVGQVL
jgi:putative transposase